MIFVIGDFYLGRHKRVCIIFLIIHDEDGDGDEDVDENVFQNAICRSFGGSRQSVRDVEGTRRP